MPLYRYTADRIESVDRTTFLAEQIRERQDLQRLLRHRIEILGKDLLVVAEEYGSFEDSRRRIDLLALDRKGTLVVIELKRTEDGGHMDLQALRYAAMVSTMTLEQLVDTYAEHNQVDTQDAAQAIGEWVDEPLDSLPNQVRIVLVSADFDTEVTSTVMWLNDNYNTNISCFRVVPYRLNTDILLDLQQIIPLPEARDYQIQQRQKSAAVVATRTAKSGRDYTRYSLRIAGKSFDDMSKQGAVKTAIQQLHSLGVSAALIREATQARRWVGVHPVEGETVEDAFRRENPSRSDRHMWFDLGVVEGALQWVMPRFGGADTETMLTALTALAPTNAAMTWRAEDVVASE
jgi:hypothetical protein